MDCHFLLQGTFRTQESIPPSLTSPALTGVFFTTSTTWETSVYPGGSDGKNPSAMQETQVRPLDWDDSLKKEMVTHSSILAWRVPWTLEPGGLQSMGVQRLAQLSN